MSLRQIPIPATVVVTPVLAAGIALSNEEFYGRVTRDIAPVKNSTYAAECGRCHFAYPPGLLPAASWERIIARLASLFGDNAELPADTAARMRLYLVANAADRTGIGRSVGLFRYDSLRTPPLRITETPCFMSKHNELPRRAVQDHPQVQSLRRCDACHTRSAQGSFSESEIRVPGFGRWDD
jgi:hypothetical protein